MKSYAALLDGSRAIVDVPVPELKEYQALLKMEACGVCNGTDIKIAHHQFKNFSTYPALLGHEGVGIVTETGAKVRHLKKGDRVILPLQESKLGEYYSGFGAYSEYCVVGDSKALLEDGYNDTAAGFSLNYHAQTVLPADIDPVEATMVVTFREVLSAAKKFGIKPNMNVVIFGLGPVGLCFIQTLKLMGIGTVIAFDVKEHKAARGMQFGADYAYSTTAVDPCEAVRAVLPQGVDMVVDAVGVTSIINTGLAMIKDSGKVCCYGISPHLDMQLDWSKAPYNWQLDFIQLPYKTDEVAAHAQVMSWIKAGALKPNDYISHVFPFNEIEKAFQMIEAGTTEMKTVIKYV